MSTFFLQSALLIAVAYFLGAIVGCWLRKLFKQSASLLHTEPLAAGVAGAGAIVASQYSAAEGEASIEINRPEPVPVLEPVRKVYIEEMPENLPVEKPFVPDLEPETITFVEAETRAAPEPEPLPEPIPTPRPVFSPSPAIILEVEPEAEPEPEIEIVEPEGQEQVVIQEGIVPSVPEIVATPVVEPVVVAASV
ncbi:MAG: hypothetical protein L3J67_12905, partial [Hyphomicrobiaceae bacterium]|nr:hypothetical protein [Hyphomicrobiaceae bacterium]